MKCSLLTLSSYVDSELPASRKGELEAHLVGCHRCRAGLGHLREEVERVEGLARVHMPESSVRLLLEHTGLIAPGEPMPAVPDATAAAAPSPTTPPWLRGGAGAALPWATGRPPSPRRALRVPAPGGPVAPPPPEPSAPPDTFDVWAAARMEPPPAVPPPPVAEPEPEPEFEAAEAPAPEALSDPAPAEETAAPEASAATGLPEPRQGRLARRRARALARREAAAVAEAIEHPGPEPAVIRPTDPEPAEAESDAAPPPLTAGSPSSTADPGTPGTVDIAAAAVPPGGDAVPVWTPESSAETPPTPRYPLTDEDALEEPTTVERFGPMPAPRPGLVDRFREKLALRRALRVAALDERDDGIEIVSGPGAPMRGPRSRGDLARRRSEALRPASRPEGGPREATPAAVDAPPERTGRREPTVDELLPPPARPSSLGGAAAPPTPPVGPAVEEQEDWTPWRPAEPVTEPPRRRRAAAPAAEVAGEERVPAAGARTVDCRRLAVVLAAAIVLMFVVGVASARSTSPLPNTASNAGDHSAPPPAVSAPQRPAVVAPAPPAPALVPAPPRPATSLPALTGAVTVGDGAPGWSVQDIRYGAHPGYLRMVLDLVPAAGAASGSPRVTLGFQDPTTLVISLDQAVAHGAPAQPLAGGLVTSISLLTPAPAAGSTAYVVKLSHPVTFTPSFATGPLRLIVDLH